ncbi:aminotransferase-like domain-containing protein [Bradyrhizobium sp. CCBAU 21362]|uniref:aminotransferase-like domain-containing protein n=1 Tax=Bradyrhizobium sp. CCBAU 21362 TaxID=1325082 RepID=UPI0023061915|nr:PLP-dependent aminotransferase family protein [Bradyrhizobium sp. CCBAU 21362]
MTKPLRLELDRSAKTPLAEQIRKGIRAAIENGVLAPGARLPSWQDLAAQLGVARGTVRSAYEKLSAAQLIVASRAAGTHVADRPSIAARQEETADPGSFMEMYRELTAGPAIFQMGVPAHETFPAKLVARIRSSAIRVEMSGPAIYPDARGELELRREIAAYLAIARGIECTASQIIITGGYCSGLGLALRVLGLERRRVWMEDPGFPITRHGLELAGLSLAPIPVDADGIDVSYGLNHEPDAALVVVTPGQQAPLGCTLSLERRLRLLDWAAQKGAWVIEDDYLSELQLKGRATPALASLDRAGRVIHIGSFSKTLTPTLRLGFLVASPSLTSQFAEVAACLAPAPGPSVQLATAKFDLGQGRPGDTNARPVRTPEGISQGRPSFPRRHGPSAASRAAGFDGEAGANSASRRRGSWGIDQTSIRIGGKRGPIRYPDDAPARQGATGIFEDFRCV